jgi:hypothetical protein
MMADKQKELVPIPSWVDLVLVLAVCVVFWAGLSLLIVGWS